VLGRLNQRIIQRGSLA